MNPKLGSAISVVKISDSLLEFFKSNTREQIRLRVQDDTIMNIVDSLDGSLSIDEIVEKYDVDKESLEKLLMYLESKGILDNTFPHADFNDYEKFRRPINFLADFSTSHNQLVEMWKNIQSAQVLIIGLGAVGAWTACNLAQSGVKRFILLDPDRVDLTNIHRQYGYSESMVGQLKTDAIEKRLLEYNPKVKVIKCNEYLDKDTLRKFDDEDIDIIINCADKPNVDTTSLWVGEYGMRHNIPHIVGGGYNMHLSLIGQTVIPGKSACVKCFQKQLEEQNTIDSNRVRKLQVKNRKVGSFGPMCSMIASFVGMEAVKVLTKCISPANTNRRGEMNVYTMDITYNDFQKRKDCEWCGDEGIYRN